MLTVIILVALNFSDKYYILQLLPKADKVASPASDLTCAW